MTRYLENIINNPEEPKFRRIRLANRVFQDKVQPIRGAFEFLQSAGFHKIQENGEEFLDYDTSDCDPETLPVSHFCLKTVISFKNTIRNIFRFWKLQFHDLSR